MSEPHFKDATVTLYAGDCLEILRELPDSSVDSVCCDPPYGLSNTSPQQVADTLVRWVNGDRDYIPAGVGFMGRAWDAFVPPVAVWDECLRVLKPGGHVLAFAGSRTHDLMTLALRLAGFEIRDSVAWLYGSGFPKSLDVSKAIDKARTEDRAPVDAVRSWLNARRLEAGLSHDAVNKHFGHASNGGGSSSAWMTNPTSKSLPTWDQWQTLKALFDFGDEMDAEVWRLNGRKGKPGDNFESREVLSEVVREVKGGSWADNAATGRYSLGEKVIRDTTPATPDAERWQGWGTALKPAHEPVVCARKPLDASAFLARIGSQLDALEDSCRPDVSGAPRSSTPTRADSSAARIGSAPASAATAPEGEPARTTRTGVAEGSSGQTATSASEWMGERFWNTVTSWRECWVELCEVTSTSTTSTATSRTTDLQTLSSCLSRITQSVTATSTPEPDSLRSLVTAADNLFAAGVLNSRSTLALSAIEPAIESTPQARPDAGGSSPAFEPIVMARKPLAGTVAGNVLSHGTGALNIDGCRVGEGGGTRGASQGPQSDVYGDGLNGAFGEVVPGLGRWPANVVLDESQADVLDEQSGEGVSTSNRASDDRTQREGNDTFGGGHLGVRDPSNSYTDHGGASRFFYVAKADASERVRVDGIAHPTVKPLSIMRWLVRLVTPEGGTVLEPFAGSGTTVEACILEGFRCIAIEREADYLPLIQQRIHRRRDPVAAVKATGDDGGLFDLLGEGA